ncbi:hypothetical protein PHMEG_00020295 [Phytophthora megakarya]|uniref:Uncharacterized protein n=1 Tax=Phytophthora megakarya TaxID=4795 RepID=A0A225VS27_9STRA|nr:hypothetical protein PHMEG_00020295 [Phytophthora megakarya]
MVELRKENNFAELQKYTELLPVKRNETRWSSTFTMVQRYIRIGPEIKKVEAVEEMLPTGAKHRKILALFEHIKKFENVCLRLQRDDTDLAEYPVMSEHLKASAKIVETPAFEAGVVNVIRGCDGSSAEKLDLKSFEVGQAFCKKRKEGEEDYACLLLRNGGKKERRPRKEQITFLWTVTIPPTSNAVGASVLPMQVGPYTSTSLHGSSKLLTTGIPQS